MSVEALARQLAAVAPATLERFLATCDAEEHEAIEAALALLERERITLLAESWPTLPPDQAGALLETLTAEQTASLQEELDIRDLDAFLEGRRAEDVRAEAEVDGCTWFETLFPSYARGGFAPHMRDLWDWAWGVRVRQRSRPFVAVWGRGMAKSTSAEGITAALGALGRRRYGLYISGTEGQADKHVMTLGAMLESKRFAAAYPSMARRAVTQYGSARGWSRTRLHTASGFVVDALGLSVEARGIRIEEERPDFIVLDDVDALTDGPAMVEKKIRLLTETILPAGSPDLTVLAIQNVIHPNSIFARLSGVADSPADFLADRVVSGPVPGIEALDVQPERQPDGGTRWTVKGGEPTWPTGYGLAEAQSAIDTFGLTAFMREVQHVVDAAPGGMFDHLTFRRADPGDVPFLVRKVCWMDPAVTDTDSSDSCAVQVDGVDAAGQMWRLWSWEARSSPQRALCLAVRVAARFGCPYVGVETDQGGDTWRSVYQEACDSVTQEDLDAAPDNEGVRPALDGGEVLPRAGLPGFTWAKAGAGHGPKVERAARMLVEYEGPRAPIHVMGTHVILEAALRRFPKTKPYDLVDSCLVAGTAVATADGPVRIEDVRAGMKVWTREGLAPVKSAGLTGTDRPVFEVATADGHRLVGTGDHPIWTKEHGWVRLSECLGLTLLTAPRFGSSTGVACTGDTQTPASAQLGSTTSRRASGKAKSRSFIAKSGSIITGRSPTATTSTTGTKTRSTTTQRTSKFSRPPSIAEYTAARGRTATGCSPTWRRSDHRPRWVTGLLSLARRSRSTPGVGGPRSNRAPTCVENAEASSGPADPWTRVTARSGAATASPSGTRVSGRSRARNAAWSSRPDGDPAVRGGSAALRVVTVRSLGDADVWNLEVDGPPEYFANGVLVHNCYWSWHDLRKGGVATLTAPRGLVGSPPIVAPRQVGATLRTPTGHVSPLTRLR